jgi:Ribbon-helix-helix protein, copG family.
MSRVTVNMDEDVERNLKAIAKNRGVSVSSFVAEAVDFYVNEMKRHRLGKQVLDMIGKAGVNKETYECLDSERSDDDHRS